MRCKRLNKKENDNLTVFFNGWGMDEKILLNLDCGNNDVFVFYDYRDFTIDNLDFSSYKSKNLIAWSLGVYVCSYFYDKFKDFTEFIAINGTQKPIDDIYGIPPLIYNLTIDNFNELSCSKFMKKVSPALANYSARNIDELKQELISIRDLKIKENLKFDKVIISTQDRIFPYKNMLNFWRGQNVKIDEINAPHYIFDLYKNWSDFL